MKVGTYLENNDEEQLTITHLRDKMKESLTNPDSEPYGNQYLKRKLREQYQDNVHFNEGEGLHDIVTMREKSVSSVEKINAQAQIEIHIISLKPQAQTI